MESIRLAPLLVTVALLWISSPSLALEVDPLVNIEEFITAAGTDFEEAPGLLLATTSAKGKGKGGGKNNNKGGGGDDDDEPQDKTPWTCKGTPTNIAKDPIRKPIKSKKYEKVPLIYLGGKEVQPTIVVDCKGNADFSTIKAAVNFLIKKPTLPNQRAVIYLRSCVYREKVLIPKILGKVTLKGEDVYGVTISWGDTAGTVAKNESGVVAPLRTYGSYSLAAMADYFVLEDVTVINTAPQPDPAQFPAIGMAVAYRITANYSAHYHNRFLSWQDTLYDHRGTHYFWGCYIQGSVDFVFGNGQTIYEKCTFYSMNTGSITAQKRFLPKQKTGFVILKSQVLGMSMTNLGRPWGNYSRVVYALSYLEGIRADQYGWNIWAPGFEFRQKQSYYAEYKCTGPSAVTGPRVPWSYQLTDKQAAPFIKYSFITKGFCNGPWLPPGPPDFELKPFSAPPRPNIPLVAAQIPTVLPPSMPPTADGAINVGISQPIIDAQPPPATVVAPAVDITPPSISIPPVDIFASAPSQ